MGNERQLLCPLCNKKKLNWNIQKQRGRCFGCKPEQRYNHITIRRLLGYVPGEHEREVMVTKEEPTERELPYMIPLLEAIKTDHYAQSLWKDRNLRFDSWHLATDWAKWIPSTNRVAFPIVSAGHEPDQQSYIARSCYRDKKGWRRLGPDVDAAIYQYPWVGTSPRSLVLVEGVWDALKFEGSPYYAIALLGTYLSPEVESWLVRTCLKHSVPVVLWFDPDAAGREATKEIRNKLSLLEPRVIHHPSEPGDMAWQDAVNIVTEELARRA